MTLAAHRQHYSVSDYVHLERYANVRHEFLDGSIFAMAGGSREHGAYAANVIALLSVQLRGRPCQVHTSDVRLRIRAMGLITYPDVSVVCGRAEYDADDSVAITNPKVLVEVLSPSTEEYDRGEKLAHYKTIPSLMEVVLVAHEGHEVEVVRRGPAGTWSVVRGGSGETVFLESVQCSLVIDEIFRDPLALAASAV